MAINKAFKQLFAAYLLFLWASPNFAQTADQGLVSASMAVAKEMASYVPNFAVVSPVLLRGGQPLPGGLAMLKKSGVRTIINLRDGKEDVQFERKEAERLGLKFVSIPMSVLKYASRQQIDKFLSVVRDATSQPVFVHCRQGQDRCGTMVAMYRMSEQAWSAEQAYVEMLNHGFHPILLGLRYSVFTTHFSSAAQKTSGQKS